MDTRGRPMASEGGDRRSIDSVRQNDAQRDGYNQQMRPETACRGVYYER